MTGAEIAFLDQCLDGATRFLEFGAGASTRRALAHTNIQRVDSVESDPAFIRDHFAGDPEILRAECGGRLTFHVHDLGPVGPWGMPKKQKGHETAWRGYSHTVFRHSNDWDLVLIDGRFRVACTLACALHLRTGTRLLIHDYVPRREYHFLEEYLTPVSHVDTFGEFTIPRDFDRAAAKKLWTRYQLMPDDMTTVHRWLRKLRERVRKG